MRPRRAPSALWPSLPLTLTDNATSLILPGAAHILTDAGDTAVFRSLGSGNWRCIAYQRSDGGLVVGWRPTLQPVAMRLALARAGR